MKRRRTEESLPTNESDSSATATSMPNEKNSAAIEEFGKGTTVILDLGVNKLLGVVMGSALCTATAAPHVLYKIRLDIGEGAIDEHLIAFGKDLVKTRCQRSDEVPIDISFGQRDERIEIGGLAVKLIDESVHYEFELSGQTFIVSEGDLNLCWRGSIESMKGR